MEKACRRKQGNLDCHRQTDRIKSRVGAAVPIPSSPSWHLPRFPSFAWLNPTAAWLTLILISAPSLPAADPSNAICFCAR